MVTQAQVKPLEQTVKQAKKQAAAEAKKAKLLEKAKEVPVEEAAIIAEPLPTEIVAPVETATLEQTAKASGRKNKKNVQNPIEDAPAPVAEDIAFDTASDDAGGKVKVKRIDSGVVHDSYNVEKARSDIGKPEFGIKAGAITTAAIDKIRGVGAFLNNILVKTGDTSVPFTVKANDSKMVGERMRSDIENSIGIRDKMNALPDIGFKVGDDAFVGATTPE
jgi:hypothetical protein